MNEHANFGSMLLVVGLVIAGIGLVWLLTPSIPRLGLDAGPAPLVFTLGSSAVLDAGRYYEESAIAAKMLGQRAVLLVG